MTQKAREAAPTLGAALDWNNGGSPILTEWGSLVLASEVVEGDVLFGDAEVVEHILDGL
jgi:hypothetical protein